MRHANIIKLFGIIALAAMMGLGAIACDGGNKLSGTYACKEYKGATMTFSGNKVSVDFLGNKRECTYEIKDGKFIETDSNGKVTEATYLLEGDTLKMTNSGLTLHWVKQ